MAKRGRGRPDVTQTVFFGNSSEYYISHLFGLDRVDDGRRLPDFVSNGLYRKPWRAELKSGKDDKGNLCSYEGHYGFVGDPVRFQEFFGRKVEDVPTRSGPLLSSFFAQRADADGPPSAFYYLFVNRLDRLKSSHTKIPLASLGLRFGNIYMVPNEWAMHSMIDQEEKSGRWASYPDPERAVLDWFCHSIADDLRGVPREGYWDAVRYNFFGRDVRAFFENDASLTSALGAQRLESLARRWPEINSLERVKIPGPNDSAVYVLAKPSDMDLVNVQLRQVVTDRVEGMEHKVRRRAELFNALVEAVAGLKGSAFFEMDHPTCLEDLGLTERQVSEGIDLEKWVGYSDYKDAPF